MVFFTCNYCGESVKKLAVEKHYNFKCRGAIKNVSCMDCQKDFHGEDYVAHTKCISEAEKYSGKDYVPKEAKNSGQKKQDSWMNIIRSILDTKEYNLSPKATAVFQKLWNLDNVPRKKAKFENFVANCLRINRQSAEEVWNILEKELEKMKANKSQTNGAAKVAESKNVIKDEQENNSENIIQQNNEEPIIQKRVKKSKKRKVDKEIQNTIEQDEVVLQSTEKDQANGEPKKKKSKKNKDSESMKATENAEQESTISTTTPDEFQWSTVLLQTVRKSGNSMKLEKLKKKIHKMYLAKKGLTTLNEKQQRKFDKKFTKYIKLCNFKIENNLVNTEQNTFVNGE